MTEHSISKLALFLVAGGLLVANGAEKQKAAPASGSPVTGPQSLLDYESWLVWHRKGGGVGYQHFNLKPTPDSPLRLQLTCEVKGKMGGGHGIAVRSDIGCRCDLYLSLLDATVRDPEGEAMAYQIAADY
jgi:hypothetical protein